MEHWINSISCLSALSHPGSALHPQRQDEQQPGWDLVRDSGDSNNPGGLKTQLHIAKSAISPGLSIFSNDPEAFASPEQHPKPRG